MGESSRIHGDSHVYSIQYAWYIDINMYVHTCIYILRIEMYIYIRCIYIYIYIHTYLDTCIMCVYIYIMLMICSIQPLMRKTGLNTWVLGVDDSRMDQKVGGSSNVTLLSTVFFVSVLFIVY